MTMRRTLAALVLLSLVPVAGCARNGSAEPQSSATTTTPPTTAASTAQSSIPPGANEAAARLAASPRHGEYVMVSAGGADSVRAWVVYPESRERAPVVLVVHEIFGLST